MPVQDAPLPLATPELEALYRALDRGLVDESLSAAALAAVNLAHLAPRLGPLAGLDAQTARRFVGTVVSERQRSLGPDVQLVWTGPEAVSGTSRDTATVVRELFARAQKSVLVAGYSFDHGGEILEPLHEAMVKRDVHASFFVDIPRAPSSARMKEHIAAWLSAFFLENWRFPRRPELYYDPRSAEPTAVASLHAKCIVVDERLALVTSANFTDRGQGRNIEVGVLVEDRRFARSLAEQWRSAVSAGVFRSLAFKQEGPRP